MTLEQALIAAVATLTGCVGGLFAWFKAQFNALSRRSYDCEKDRIRLWQKLAEIAHRVEPGTFSMGKEDKNVDPL